MLKRLTTLILLIGFGGSALAADITVTPADCDDLTGTITCFASAQNNAEDAADLALWFGGAPSDYTLSYKSDQGGGESGAPAFQSAYETTYTPDTDPSTAWIQYVGGDSITCTVANPCYFVAKDGNATPNVIAYEITDWGPGDDFTFSGFFQCSAEEIAWATSQEMECKTGSFSHVSIWGGERTTNMPEPGTLALLGLGLFGMGVMRRRRTA